MAKEQKSHRCYLNLFYSAHSSLPLCEWKLFETVPKLTRGKARIRRLITPVGVCVAEITLIYLLGYLLAKSFNAMWQSKERGVGGWSAANENGQVLQVLERTGYYHRRWTRISTIDQHYDYYQQQSRLYTGTGSNTWCLRCKWLVQLGLKTGKSYRSLLSWWLFSVSDYSA